MAVFIEQLKNAGFLDTVTITIAQVGSRKVGNLRMYGFDGWFTKFSPSE